MILVYIVVYGPAEGDRGASAASPRGQELLLGLGSTLGIVLQLLILLPYLRRAGFLYRPRLDLRGSGLGHTLRLGVWTVLFVDRQPDRLRRRAAARDRRCGRRRPTAPASPSTPTRFLVVMVPHSIVTVSLATAMLPRLSAHAAAGDRPALAGVAVEHAARRAGGDRAVRRAAAGHRARPGPRGLRARRRGRGWRRRLRADALAVRPRHPVLHRPLPGAARLLRPRAEPHRLLRPVRGRGHQHRRRGRPRRRHHGPAHLARPRRRLRRSSYAVGATVSYLLLQPPPRRAAQPAAARLRRPAG